MCGIAGFVDFKHQSLRSDLDAMTDAMPHRGPDGRGVFYKPHEKANIGLGHRRLSIIDLSHAADQPMAFDDLYIVFNGEIYNYQFIKDELTAAGHVFNTSSDTEVILHAWRTWGPSCLKRFRGMFAFVLFDAKDAMVYMVRDRAGVKPLHYYWKDGQLFFGSELKCLMAHRQYPKNIEPAAVAAFLQYGHVPTPHCIFKDTYKLKPGHFIKLDLNTNQLSTHCYWSVNHFYTLPKLNMSLKDAIDETERLLSESFQLRMVADVPVGVFLSGGYDSTCVAALLQKSQTSRLKTFTIGTDNHALNEAQFAKETAAYLGTDHTEYYCSAQEALDMIPQLPFYYDEPFADSSAIPTMLVSKVAREQVTVALSADAGDEIFAGYNRYDYIYKYQQKIARLPKWSRSIIARAMNMVSPNQLPVLKNKPLLHSRYDKIKAIVKDPSTSQLLCNLTQVISDDAIGDWMANERLEALETAYVQKELEKTLSDPLDYMMAIDYQTYLLDDILQKVDRATMSVSLEGREPFLDQTIIEFAAQLPSYYKYHNQTKKYILKQIVHKYVPEKMLNRPKMGFAIPVKDWLSNELKDWMCSYVNETALNAHGLMNTTVVMRMRDDFLAGRTEHYLKLWYVLMFQMWYKQWM